MGSVTQAGWHGPRSRGRCGQRVSSSGGHRGCRRSRSLRRRSRECRRRRTGSSPPYGHGTAPSLSASASPGSDLMAALGILRHRQADHRSGRAEMRLRGEARRSIPQATKRGVDVDGRPRRAFAGGRGRRQSPWTRLAVVVVAVLRHRRQHHRKAPGNARCLRYPIYFHRSSCLMTRTWTNALTASLRPKTAARNFRRVALQAVAPAERRDPARKVGVIPCAVQ